MQHTHFTLVVVSISVALFVTMLIFFELGRRFGTHMLQRKGPDARIGVGSVDSAVFALLALLIGFTFSGATSRFDNRRQLVIDEVNAASTAWMRIDALPQPAQEPIRAGLRQYLDALLVSYGSPDESLEEARALADLTRAQNDLWAKAVAACLAEGGEKARMLLLPSVNEMFDAADKEHLNGQVHPPLLIYGLLAISAMAAALFGGYNLASGATRNWFLMIGVSATIAVAVYVILELEFPRNGVVRVDPIDNSLVTLRASMK